MISFVKSLFKGTLNLLQAVIIAFLILIATYGTYSITKNFIAKDSATVATIEKCPNALPYVAGISVELIYDQSEYDASIFPETWALNQSELDTLFPGGGGSLDRLNLRVNESIFYSTISQNESLSLENCIDLASLSGIVVAYDKAFVYGFTNHRVMSYGYNPNEIRRFFKNLSQGITAYGDTLGYYVPDGAHTPEMASLIDAFLENPSAGILIDKAISRAIGPNFARIVLPNVQTSSRNIPVKFTVDELYESSLLVFIPFDFAGNVSTPSIKVEFLPMNASRGPKLDSVNIAVGHQFYLNYVSSSLVQIDVEIESKNKGANSIVLVKNAGFFDSSLVRSKSECDRCRNLYSVEHCEFKCLVDSVIDLCRCIPFTFRRLYSFDHSKKAFPYCTTKKYGKCLDFAVYEPSRCHDNKITPCLTVRNQMEQTRIEPFDLNDAGREQYRVTFKVLSEQKAYILLRERPPCTWIEVLGQIGGTVGMFISFSLLGLWQFGVFIYTSYKQHYKTRAANKTEKARSTLGLWLNMARMQSAVGPREDESQNNAGSETSRILEETKKQYEGIEKRYDILEKTVRDTEGELGEKNKRLQEEIEAMEDMAADGLLE